VDCRVLHQGKKNEAITYADIQIHSCKIQIIEVVVENLTSFWNKQTCFYVALLFNENLKKSTKSKQKRKSTAFLLTQGSLGTTQKSNRSVRDRLRSNWSSTAATQLTHGLCYTVRQLFFNLSAAAEPSANVCIAHGTLCNDPSYNRIETWLQISSQAISVCFGGTPGSLSRNPGWKSLLCAYISLFIEYRPLFEK